MGSNSNSKKAGVVAAGFLLLYAALVLAQRSYDVAWLRTPRDLSTPSPLLVRGFDMGLHAAVSSLMWINVRTELPFLADGPQKFDNDLALINNLDPKFSAPYSFAVIVLPNTRYPRAAERAVLIGENGVRQADPDWRIPFYLAVDYFLYLHDDKNAAYYFDFAARTPGIPDIVRRYAVNYGAFRGILEKTKSAWIAIYESTHDEIIRERARAYIAHYEIVEFLNGAVSLYSSRYGNPPKQIEDLVTGGVIAEIPKDPFGFEFTLYSGEVGFKSPKR